MFLVATLPALVFGVATFCVPESPRWLAQVGHEERAREIFTRISGAEAAERSLHEVHLAIARETGRITELFHRGTRKALGIAVFLGVFSELSGITVVLY